jgi:hypothetical protein
MFDGKNKGGLKGLWRVFALPLFLSACNMLPNASEDSGGRRHTPDPMNQWAPPQRMPQPMSVPPTSITMSPPPAATAPPVASMEPDAIAAEQAIVDATQARGRVKIKDAVRYLNGLAAHFVSDTVSDIKALPDPTTGTRAGRDADADTLGDYLQYDLQAGGSPAGNPTLEQTEEYQLNQFVVAGSGVARASGDGLEDGVCVALPVLGGTPLGDRLKMYISLTPWMITNLNTADGKGLWDLKHETNHCLALYTARMAGETKMMNAMRNEMLADVGMWLDRIQNNEDGIADKMQAFIHGRDLGVALFPEDHLAHATGAALQPLLDEYKAGPDAFRAKIASMNEADLTEYGHKNYVLPSLGKYFLPGDNAANLQANQDQEARLMAASQYAHDALYASGPMALPPALSDINDSVIGLLTRANNAVRDASTLGSDNGLTYALQHSGMIRVMAQAAPPAAGPRRPA